MCTEGEMKKLVLLLLFVSMVFIMNGCGGKHNQTPYQENPHLGYNIPH